MRFGIESSILFQRIANDRRRKQEELLRDRERAQKREQAGEPVVEVTPAKQDPEAQLLENRTLAPAERDLLYFLLTYGTDELDFETDSPYYSGSEEEKPTVAQFIREALEDDNTVFANSAYRALYDAYMRLYDAGLDQNTIVKSLLDGEDRTLAALAGSFSTEKYQLTVGAFEASLTSRTTFLVSGVPKAIMVYAERRVQDRLDTLRRSLSSAPAQEQMDIMQEMLRLQAAQRRIRQRIGREKSEKS